MSPPGPRLRAAATAVVAMLGLAARAHPAGCAAILALEVVQGLLPLGTAWVAKQLFDLLALALGAGGSPPDEGGLLLLVAAQAGLLVAGQLLGPLSGYQQAELGRRLALEVQARVYGKVNGFAGMAYFEDPRFHDTLQLAVQGAEQQPRESLTTAVGLFRNAVTLGAFLTVLTALDGRLALLVLTAALPQLLAQLRFGRQSFELAAETTPEKRRAFTYRLVLSLDRFAKELRLFQLGGFFLRTLLGCERRIHAARRALERRQLGAQLLPATLGSLAAAAAFLAVVRQAFAGAITLGDVSLYLGAVASVQGALAGLISGLSRLHEGGLFFSHYQRLMALPQPIPLAPAPRPLPRLRHGVELRGVSFRYGPGHPWVLRDLDLRIPAGATVALVGLNGAGKTTLVKLLGRLYDPTEGAVLWDGVDLRQFDPEAVRSRLAAVFQDFARYDLSVRENVGLGRVERLDDLERIRAAARDAGIHEAVERLPEGYDTFLNRWLARDDAGAELSGGEWQKVAIARLFMRRGELLVLDEPTAALDAQAELELFERFAALTAGRTSLVISHRFSTVRTADLIAVLDGGRITELGSHRELVARGGTYARLYRLQAERYAEPATPPLAAAG